MHAITSRRHKPKDRGKKSQERALKRCAGKWDNKTQTVAESTENQLRAPSETFESVVMEAEDSPNVSIISKSEEKLQLFSGRVETSKASVVNIKASVVILLLGIGSLLCYKICNHYWPKRRPRHRSSFQHRRRDSSPLSLRRNSSDASVKDDTDAEELIEDLEEGEFNGTEGCYFGPEKAGDEEGESEEIKDRRAACYSRLSTPNPSPDNPYTDSSAQSVYLSFSISQSESTTSEDEGCDADISEGSLLERLPEHHNASQNQPVEEQHPRQSLSWYGAKAVTPKYASRPTSLDGSFMEHQLPTFSGSLVNTVSKLITSTPETLQLSEISEEGALSQSDDEQMAKLELDEEDLYPVDNSCKENNFVTANDIETSLEISGRNGEEDVTLIDATDISPVKHETLADPEENASDSMTSSVTASMMTERSSKTESSGFTKGSSTGTRKKIRSRKRNYPVERRRVRETLNQPPGPSGSAQQSASSAVGVENVSQRVDLMQYAKREGQGDTQKAKTILKGYAEIPSVLGLQYMRRIRGDNYCAVRSAIFQVLANGIPIPSGTEAFQYLSQALNDKKCKWLQNWTFAGWLSYNENNVMQGMKVCLQYLDSVASVLSSVNDNKEDMLVALLNSQPITDLHIMEAVKLHMLYHAMQLHENDLYDLEVPFFAILMFARDTSKTPEDFMNNHLREVGDTGGLEQVEMCLLAHALGVTIRVVRPCAYGTDGFICSYPDYNEGYLPQIFLIAEEDVHYNVLVN